MFLFPARKAAKDGVPFAKFLWQLALLTTCSQAQKDSFKEIAAVGLGGAFGSGLAGFMADKVSFNSSHPFALGLT